MFRVVLLFQKHPDGVFPADSPSLGDFPLGSPLPQNVGVVGAMARLSVPGGR